MGLRVGGWEVGKDLYAWSLTSNHQPLRSSLADGLMVESPF